MDRKNAWIIGVAVVLAALLVVLALVIFRSQDNQKECDRLRARVENFYAQPVAEYLDDVNEMDALGCER